MSDNSVPTLSDLPLHQAEAVERTCTRFENDWKAWRGGPPRVEAYLEEEDGPFRAVLLAELVRLEIAYRLMQGESPNPAEYRERFPDQTWLDQVLQTAGCTLDGDPREVSIRRTLGLTTETPSQPDAADGFGVPGYDLLERLEPGGMGIVYKARDTKLNRIVALKMILAGEHADEAERNRFKTEAEAIARLQHPGIVQIFEVGEQPTGDDRPPRPFIALEYCAGGNLDRKLAGTPMQPMDAAALVEQLARAVQAAHEAHVLHRDLKPANVLLTADGTPKITDFGLAKKLDEEGKTQTGAVMGSPSYMAPEQAQGKSRELGPACDVYGLGAILYECLTGRPPFKAATVMDTLMHVVTQEPVPPRQLNAKVPVDLETICLKCLSKEPGKRYGSALFLADDLARFQKHEPIIARRVGRTGRLLRWCQRNPPLAASLAGSVLILLAGVVVSTFFAIESNLTAQREKQRADAEQEAKEELAAQKKETEQALRASEQQRMRSDFVAYAYRIDKARQAVRRGQIFKAQDILRTCDPKLCCWEHDFLFRQTIIPHMDFRGHKGIVQSIAYSSDGKRIVSGGGMSITKFGEVKVWDAQTGKEVLSLNMHTDRVNSVCFSPDGKRIVSASSDRTMKLWDVQTGEEILSFKGPTSGVRSVCFSPDGKRIVSGSSDKKINLWDAQTGEEALTLKGHSKPVYSVAFSPDGKRIVSGGGGYDLETMQISGEVKVWDAKTGEAICSLMGHTAGVNSVAFSPDGKRIVSGSVDKTIKLWKSQTGEEAFTLKGHAASVTSVAFSPDGKHIVSGSVDETVKVWDVQTGEEALTLEVHPALITSVCFSPDGKCILGGSMNTVKVWHVTPRKEALTLEGHPAAITSVCFSPDGKRIVSGGESFLPEGSGVVIVSDAETGEVVLFLQGHTGSVESVCFSPDGKRIVSGGGGYDLEKMKSWGEVVVWDAQTGHVALTLKGHTSRVDSVAFSPDGKHIVGGGDDFMVKVWDAQTGNEKFTLTGHTGTVISVAFSPDGKQIVSGSSDKTIKLWDAQTAEETLTLKGHSMPVTSVAFSPDGKRIVSGSSDRTVKAWDAQTGGEALTLKGHTSRVDSVAFSPDGKRIITGSRDTTVKVWDAQTGEEAISLEGHTSSVLSVAFSPDSKRIVSGSADRTIKVWNAAIGN